MSIDLSKVNNRINELAELINEKRVNEYTGNLRVGVDLGTANIVLIAIDDTGKPIAGALYPANVVKDGLVIDYIGAIRIVEKLKKDVEDLVGITLTYSATAMPPGTTDGNLKAFSNVLEAADLKVTAVVNEPTAAATLLNVSDGAVVDIGGGTTGISIFKNGKVIYTADEPTGGTHVNLVIAGSYQISIGKAEKMKNDPSKKNALYPIIRPVFEKMASIVKKHIEGYQVETIYLVGGTTSFDGIEKVFFETIGTEIIKPVHPHLITPLGIAFSV